MQEDAGQEQQPHQAGTEGPGEPGNPGAEQRYQHLGSFKLSKKAAHELTRSRSRSPLLPRPKSWSCSRRPISKENQDQQESPEAKDISSSKHCPRGHEGCRSQGKPSRRGLARSGQKSPQLGDPSRPSRRPIPGRQHLR